MTVTTEVIRASGLEMLIATIARTRYSEQLAKYQEDLKAYERDRKRRRKEEIEMPDEAYWLDEIGSNGWIGAGIQATMGARPKRPLGYQVVRQENGITTVEFVKRPMPPRYHIWHYSPYERSSDGSTAHAYQDGLLANPMVNREISPRRVAEYRALMRKGLWRDLLSDPITITADGHVVNGQHRLAAASQVDWDKVDNNPLFLVVIGVSSEEAILADKAKRTGRDQSTIAAKVLARP